MMEMCNIVADVCAAETDGDRGAVYFQLAYFSYYACSAKTWRREAIEKKATRCRMWNLLVSADQHNPIFDAEEFASWIVIRRQTSAWTSPRDAMWGTKLLCLSILHNLSKKGYCNIHALLLSPLSSNITVVSMFHLEQISFKINSSKT